MINTKDIKVTKSVIPLLYLVTKGVYLTNQHNPHWNNKKMSLLIESLLLRVPIHAFYFDVSDPNKWVILDGLQRLYVLKSFMVDKTFRLTDLEFLSHLNGSTWDDLLAPQKRLLDQTEIVTYQVEAQTPKEILAELCKRLRTS